jgi:hypothetical protein
MVIIEGMETWAHGQNHLQSTHVYTPSCTKKKKNHQTKRDLPLKSLVLP